MASPTFNFEERRLAEEIRKRKAKFVLIQLPEGLKPHGARLAKTVEETGALAIISADPCYGACDIAILEAERLGADLLIHYGHSEMVKQTTLPILYVEAKARSSIKTAVRKALPILKPWNRIGLVSTVQHVEKLEEARRLLLNAGKSVAVGDRGRLKYPGQVTGCDYSNARAISTEVDVFLFIGGGRFHAVGVALATAKLTIVADPYERNAFLIENEPADTLRKRWASIREAKNAEEFGIIIGLKAGQKRLDEALKMKRLVENSGKKAFLLALREVTPEALTQFPTIDVFVNTACPRISLEDSERFRKPTLTPMETSVALGALDWEELCRRGWFEN